MTKAVQWYGKLLFDQHLSIVGVVVEYLIISDKLYNIIKAFGRYVEVRSKYIWPVDLVVIQQKGKLVAIFGNSFMGCVIMLGVQLTHDI